MKIFVIFLAAFFAVSCQTASSKAETTSEKQVVEQLSTGETKTESASIRQIDFQNFTYPWTKTFGFKEKSFTLKNGMSALSDGRKLSLKALSYIEIADDFDEQALVNINIEDGNATYKMLYVFAIENNQPKLLESFEFGENNIFLGTAFEAHGELVIASYHRQSGDAECCPSVIELSQYKWQKDKFVLQGKPQKVSNGYVGRMKSFKSE